METVIKPQPNYVHDPQWATCVSRLVKAQMAASGMSYSDLSNLLKDLGTVQSPENLRVKINRGNFGAQLFIQLFLVMGKSEISMKEIENLVLDNG